MEFLNHSHYFPLPSQGNINSLTFLKLVNGTCKILVATLRRQVFCLEYVEKANSVLAPTSKEISFTYIPTSVEIVSIDAFNKSTEKNDFVIGITIIKKNHKTPEAFLNIYSEYEENGEFNIESIAQNCLNVPLNYIPHYHGHTKLIEWTDDKITTNETVIVITGGDSKFHVFREVGMSEGYKEILGEKYFPEFSQPPDIVTWVEICYVNNYSERLTVFGTEMGYIRMCVVDVKTRTVMKNHTVRFSTYVSHIKIYPENKQILKPPFVKECYNKKTEEDHIVLNVIVANTLLPCVVFRDCLEYGMDKYRSIRRSDTVSLTSCIEVADLDFDGHNEILIGNNIQQILLFKINKKEQEWRIKEMKQVVSPIFRIKYIDLTRDGVKELVVFTMKGIYIFQHDANYLHAKIQEKVEKMTSLPVTIENMKIS